jgi:hypothetical protein
MSREFTAKRSTTHGLGKPPEYRSWSQMRNRCQNPNSRKYLYYGARGIKVCDRWQSFAAFYEDMGPRPSPKHSIDRFPDNDGNYEPGNCRWATYAEQNLNYRRNRRLTYKGETKTVKEWAAIVGLPYQCLLKRITKSGWSVVHALETPARRNVGGRYTYG